MSIKIQNIDDANWIAKIIDYIVKAEDSDKEKQTVGYIKKRFGLSEEQYVLIFELAMPAIRYAFDTKRWATCSNHNKFLAKKYRFLYESLKAGTHVDEDAIYRLVNEQMGDAPDGI